MHDEDGLTESNGSAGGGTLIGTDAELAAFLPAVEAAAWLAVDTEADSLHAYPEKLCLIQLSIPGRDELIDPLAKMDLQPLFARLEGRRLILHGADYDLRLLQRAHQFVPTAIFDTMLAARLLDYPGLGLEKLVERVLGQRLEKGPQRANWARRPLTRRMADYARNDTRYLKPLADHLTGELEAKGRWSWFEETCDRLIRDSTSVRPEDPDEVWRLSGCSRLDRRALAVLRELWLWREGEARRVNRPPYFVVSHEKLVQMAARAAAGLPLADQLSTRWSSARRDQVLNAVSRALALSASEWPRHRQSRGLRLNGRQRARLLQLTEQRDREARRLQLDPAVVATRLQLVQLAAGVEDGRNGLMRWQRALLGAGGGSLSATGSGAVP